jgi:hypothetical protein
MASRQAVRAPLRLDRRGFIAASVWLPPGVESIDRLDSLNVYYAKYYKDSPARSSCFGLIAAFKNQTAVLQPASILSDVALGPQ